MYSAPTTNFSSPGSLKDSRGSCQNWRKYISSVKSWKIRAIALQMLWWLFLLSSTVPSQFKISIAGTNTGTHTGTHTGTCIGTCTGTRTGTRISTRAGTCTGTRTGMCTGTRSITRTGTCTGNHTSKKKCILDEGTVELIVLQEYLVLVLKLLLHLCRSNDLLSFLKLIFLKK